MKDEWTSEPVEIEILPKVKELWLKLTGTVPVKRNYRTAWDSKNENDLKIIKMIMGAGVDPTMQHEAICFKPVTDNKVELVRTRKLLQYKEEIRELWNILHKNLASNDWHCCICGTQMHKPFYYGGMHYGATVYSSKTTCYRNSGVKSKGENHCPKIRRRMINYLKILKRKINRLENKKVCIKCNEEFNTPRKDTKFCSVKCRVAHFRANNPRYCDTQLRHLTHKKRNKKNKTT